MKQYFFTEAKAGVPAPSAVDKFVDTIKGFNGRLMVTVEKKRNNRSLEQNRWMWACTTIMANELGYTKDEMHGILNYKFLTVEKVDENTGEVFKYVKSSANLTTTEFSELMESMIRWAAETFEIVLPYPEEQLRAEL